VVCGGAGHTDWDVWDCDALFDGGVCQTEASGCCVAGFCPGPTVMRVGPVACAGAPEEAGGFAASFGLGFGFGLAASAAAGGVGPETAASGDCSGGGS
jgi:hypothetical protein